MKIQIEKEKTDWKFVEEYVTFDVPHCCVFICYYLCMYTFFRHKFIFGLDIVPFSFECHRFEGACFRVMPNGRCRSRQLFNSKCGHLFYHWRERTRTIFHLFFLLFIRLGSLTNHQTNWLHQPDKWIYTNSILPKKIALCKKYEKRKLNVWHWRIECASIFCFQQNHLVLADTIDAFMD